MQLIPKEGKYYFSKKGPWILASTVIWLTVAGLIGGVAVYLSSAVDAYQLKQVYQLRGEMDSISDRGYLLQHKIDSLNRLGVAKYPTSDSSTVFSNNETKRMIGTRMAK